MSVPEDVGKVWNVLRFCTSLVTSTIGFCW